MLRFPMVLPFITVQIGPLFRFCITSIKGGQPRRGSLSRTYSKIRGSPLDRDLCFSGQSAPEVPASLTTCPIGLTVMIETLRRYWIALLVLVLVGLHASIIAVIRMQATQAKVTASCEVDLGSFTVMQPGESGFVQLHVHAVVPAAHRIQARSAFEQRQWELRQNVEETLRQLDPALLQDPYLDAAKSLVTDVLVQTVGKELVDRVLITEMAPQTGRVLVFTKVAPRRYDHHEEKGGDHGHEEGEGHGESEEAHGSGHEKAPAKSKGH